MFEKPLESFRVLCFQQSMWTAWSLAFWEIQSIMTRESPQTSKWSICHLEASQREVQRPRSSALLFDPGPQFRYHLVILLGCALKYPPAPQQLPDERVAPSKHARECPAGKKISIALRIGGLKDEGCQLKETRTL
jgi:hypothetical protein